jgi:predicted TIM-barrel fold metal-dependent hydrolase
MPQRVANVAARAEFSEVNFILYHAGLDPPDEGTGVQALQLAVSQPNLYMDISWLDLGRLRQALDIVPMERILFGTDLPLGGEDHYREYFEKLDSLGLTNEQWVMLLKSNSQKLFGL